LYVITVCMLFQANRVEKRVIKYGLPFSNEKCRMVSFIFSLIGFYIGNNLILEVIGFRIKSRWCYIFIIGDILSRLQNSFHWIWRYSFQ